MAEKAILVRRVLNYQYLCHRKPFPVYKDNIRRLFRLDRHTEASIRITIQECEKLESLGFVKWVKRFKD